MIEGVDLPVLADRSLAQSPLPRDAVLPYSNVPPPAYTSPLQSWLRWFSKSRSESDDSRSGYVNSGDKRHHAVGHDSFDSIHESIDKTEHVPVRRRPSAPINIPIADLERQARTGYRREGGGNSLRKSSFLCHAASSLRDSHEQKSNCRTTSKQALHRPTTKHENPHSGTSHVDMSAHIDAKSMSVLQVAPTPCNTPVDV